jgi:hypothetical protein
MTSGAPTAKQLWGRAASAAHPTRGILAIISIQELAAKASRAVALTRAKQKTAEDTQNVGGSASSKEGCATGLAEPGAGGQSGRDLVPSSITKSQLQIAKVVSQVIHTAIITY